MGICLCIGARPVSAGCGNSLRSAEARIQALLTRSGGAPIDLAAVHKGTCNRTIWQFRSGGMREIRLIVITVTARRVSLWCRCHA
jgi:hypothetical protein